MRVERVQFDAEVKEEDDERMWWMRTRVMKMREEGE